MFGERYYFRTIGLFETLETSQTSSYLHSITCDFFLDELKGASQNDLSLKKSL